MSTRSRQDTARPSIADHLAREIFSGRYQPGDFVPKEVDLAERFAINRSAVRSDLRQLVDVGIIERISGHGSKVREYDAWNILDPLVTDWMTRYAAPNPEIQREILAFRLDVEPYVGMTAARRANARDLVAIEEAFEGMEREMHRSGQDAKRLHSDYDIAFHVAIFRATHNIVWAQLSHILRPSIHMLIEMSNESATDPEASLERHRDLMEAIRARRPAAAFRAAQAVLAGTADALGIAPGDAILGSQLDLPPKPA
ncbi:FadR/GntR family transcriptional regulator [Halomonas maura]|uniref:FadR/GntR family transcriptional regulator n=1 Tax=Halomonas maura TaxID=117606 RepID=UPI0025B5CE42|nr:FCD domain-containing protein [Halomonas maura]MDN3556170.1 FCD domain-containing protein [Halomonas maura]